MGQKISQIAYNEEFEDLQTQGLSKTQVSLIQEHFYALCEGANRPDKTINASMLSQLLKIPKKEAKLVVEFADIDGDGKLNDYDFVCLVGLFTKGKIQDKLEGVFYLFDEDYSQLMSEQELENLIRCVLCVNENTIDIDQNLVLQKKQEILNVLFCDDNELKISEFLTLAKEDFEFQNAFKKLGIFREDDLQLGYNEDLEEEFKKGEDEFRDENFDDIKNGLEVAKEGMFELQQNQADEFMAVKPFLGTVKNSVPSDFNESQDKNLSEPNASLNLEFVHGYRCFDTRNNIHYVDEDNILFHSAAVGIVMNTNQNKQKFNFGNSDDIISIAKHEDVVATGQIGHKPVINLWSSSTQENFSVIIGELQKGIAHLAISHDGKYLAGTAMNDEHDIAVYDISNIRQPVLIKKSKGVRDVVLNLQFSKDNKQLIMASKKELYFANLSGSKMRITKATGWQKQKPMSLAIAFLQKTDCLVGLNNGNIAVIKGTSVSKQIKAHKGCVYALKNNKDMTKLFTGGADGKVIIFDSNLSPLKEIIINSNGFKSINPKVRALDFCESQKKLLIGTRGGEIIEHEIQTQQQKFILKGHFSKELWGLAVHPLKKEYVTVGEDFLLAKWSLQQRENLLSKKLKFEANTLTVSPQGTQIAIGCKNGYLLVLNYSNFQQLKCKRVSKKELTQVKYSPCGKYLAAGARDSKIYIFETSAKFKRISICKGHHSTITHLDFSEDSSVLQSNCTSYEILYWNVKSGKQDTRGASNNRDENWASWTCVLGWPVQGIFPPCSDGTDVNSVDRTKNKKVMATGDDFGNVKLFKCPNFKGSSYQKFQGHSSHVTNVRFSSCQDYLISVGGNDKSVFQWKYKDFENEDEEEEEYEEDEEIDYLQMPIEEEQDLQNYGMFQVEEVEAVEFMASKPWVGDLQNSIPSDFKYQRGMEDPPSETLQLHYINGYRCFDTRYSARILDDSNVVFISAALGVKMNHESNTQTFFNEHEEDLVSFDLHPDRQIAASGQMAMKGKSKLIDIFVWDVNNKEVLANLTGFHLRAIQLLKFSPSGQNLFSFGKDDDNSLAVYDWKNQRLLATAKVDKKNVLDISFMSENDFLTVGSKHVKMWKLNGTRVQGTKLSWKGSCKPESVLCCQGVPKFGYVIGTIKGKLIPVRGGIGVPIQAHQGKIYVLFYDQQSNTLFTGGEDGIVKSFSLKGGLKEIQTIVSVNTNESFSPKIRALDIHEDQLLIGTGGSELFVVDQYKNNNNKKKILNGHYSGELWGLSCHPQSDQYVTCGDDYTIRVWSAQQRTQVAAVKLQEKLRAISYSNNGQLIACASYTGKIHLYDSNLKQLSTFQSSFTKKNQWIEDIKFSPDDQYIAFGAHGGASKLQILKLSSSNTLKKYALVNAGLTSALLHLDWSVDSSQIVVNSQAYELKFVDIFSKKQIRASSVKDQDWFSWTCKLGFPVQGIYPGVDGTDVNTVDRAKSKTLLATGDDFQLVKLFKCPSVEPKSCFNSYKGHASHVTRVRFLQNDKYLISTGGNDKTSIIWKVIKEDDEEEEEDEDYEGEFVHKKIQRDKYGYEQEEEEQEEEVEMLGGFQIEHVEETEFMAVKPWLGAIKAPSTFVSPEPDQNEKPNVQIELEYVYGYRSKDCRNNLYLVQDNLYYFAAALGICLNYESNTQKHFNVHRDDVIAMDYDKNKGIFATGELGPKPWICLWNQNSMQLIATLKEGIIKGIQALKFSPDGSKLVAVCIDDNSMVVVFDIDSQKMIANEKGDTAKIIDVEWTSNNEFVTSGLRHFKSWKLNNNGVKSNRGSFKKGSSDKLVFCKLVNNKILCGAFKGELQMWTGSQCSKSIKLGKGSVDALCAGQSGLIYVGGKQKKLFILDQSFRKQSELDLSKYLFQSMSLQIRSIQVNENETELYLGMYSSQIFKISGQNSEKISEFANLENLNVQELMTGHYARNLKWTNEIWGLYPLMNETFLTVSDDAILRMWDKKQRKQIKYLELNIDKKGAKLVKDKVTKDLQDQAKLRSVAVSYDQKYAAVGCKEGSVRIINLLKWKQVKILKRRKRWIQTLRFSPDDTKLAVGSHDCYIDIYDVSQNFKIVHKLKKHSSFITHLDWSIDSSFLHTTCGAYELLFWDVCSGKQLTRGASALRDEEWATWSCVLGWPVQGVFKAEWDGSDVNMIDRSNNEIADGYKIIACADDFSEIRIYKYPCLDKVTQGLRLRGHSSHVTNVKFDNNDQYLFSAGGEDQCIMQWKIL